MREWRSIKHHLSLFLLGGEHLNIVNIIKFYTHGYGLSFHGMTIKLSQVFQAIPESVKSSRSGNGEYVCLPGI